MPESASPKMYIGNFHYRFCISPQENTFLVIDFPITVAASWKKEEPVGSSEQPYFVKNYRCWVLII